MKFCLTYNAPLFIFDLPVLFFNLAKLRITLYLNFLPIARIHIGLCLTNSYTHAGTYTELPSKIMSLYVVYNKRGYYPWRLISCELFGFEYPVTVQPELQIGKWRLHICAVRYEDFILLLRICHG